MYAPKACLRPHEPLHADGTVFHIPTRSIYLCYVLVYNFEFPTFNEINVKALANTSQYVVLPPNSHSVPIAWDRHGASLQVQR